MPFRSEAQRRFMYSEHPDIAERWSKEYGSAVDPNGDDKMPETKRYRKPGDSGTM